MTTKGLWKNEYVRVSQAERIIGRFGGAYALARAFALVGEYKHVSAIYRWTYPKEKGGTGGLIPTRAIQAIKRVARLEGVILSPEDWAAEDSLEPNRVWESEETKRQHINRMKGIRRR